MPRSNFIEMMTRPGDGRCRVCEFAYTQYSPEEVQGHREFHRRYLDACDGVGAPVHEEVRERLRSEGLELAHAGTTFAERVKGAEMWLTGKYHDYLYGVLLYDMKERLDLRGFFTKRVEDGGLLSGNLPDDVAHELRFRYSDHPIY